MMKKKEQIRVYYKNIRNEKMEDFEKLGWESREAQYKRFSILVSNVELKGKRILDVGCGLGNLKDYLDQQGIQASYTGVDLLQDMVEQAAAKHVGTPFYCLDIFKENPFGMHSFDIIYSSGIFNLNLGNNKEFLKNAIVRFFELSRHGAVFNLLHDQSPDRDDEYFYFSPKEVSEIVEKAVPANTKVQIYQGYLNNDFTVICKR